MRTAWSATRVLAFVASPVLLLLVASCEISTNKLLSVQTPDVIPPNVVANAAGAEAERLGALVRFGSTYAGGLGYQTADGLLTDQLTSGRQQLNFMDQRAWDVSQVYELYFFWSFQQQAERAIAAMRQYSPDNATRTHNFTELYAQLAVMYGIVGETTCNGIAIAHLLPGGTPTYEINLTDVDAFNRALAYLDSATALAPTDANLVNLIAVTRGRILLNLATGPSDAKVAQAAAAVAGVPTTFRYDATFTATLNNGLSQWIQQSGNFSVSDKEGGTGLDYISSGDPRVGAFAGARARLGQDGITPIYFPRQSAAVDQPQVVASGTEARLIESEAQLAAGGAWLTTLNTLRDANPPWPGTCYATPTTTGPCASLVGNLTDPGAPDSRVDLLFRERAFWLYLTAHRTGDLRRLIRQYGRAAESVFPTGVYIHGGVYGPDVNMPVTQHDWSLIPGYQGCTDRNP